MEFFPDRRRYLWSNIVKLCVVCKPCVYITWFRFMMLFSLGTCKNNGVCENRPGSFSCSCPNSNVTGKLCQYDKNICIGKCQKPGEECYPKENSVGYECIANAQTVSMVYQLDGSQLPFENWMIHDIAQSIEKTIVTSGINEVCIILFVCLFSMFAKRFWAACMVVYSNV